MSETSELGKCIARDTRFFPTLIAAGVFAYVLLFVDKLTDRQQEWLIPAVASYVIGTAIVAYLQTMLHIRAGAKI